MSKLFLLAILSQALAFGQPRKAKGAATPSVIPHLSSLAVGDTLPLGTLNPFLQTPAAQLLIVDFFATWCGACIKELPKLDSLSKKFAPGFQVVLVAYEPAANITALRKKNRAMNACTLPVITSDTVLHQLFPHRLLPHTVWIDRAGRVLAITEPHHVTAANIEAALAGKALRLPLKQDALEFNRFKPLLQHNNGGTEAALRFCSLLTAYLPGVAVSSSRVVEADSTRQRFSFINHSILSLYTAATGLRYSNRWQLLVSDTAAFINPGLPYSQWAQANVFCYELTLPASLSRTQARAWMQADLDRFFNITSGWQKQKLACLALVRTGLPDSLFLSKGGKSLSTLLYRDSVVKKLHNSAISKLVEALNITIPGRPNPPIVVDETGITANVSLTLNLPDLYNLPLLRKALAPYGLDLVQVERELEVFVLSAAPATANNH